MRASILTSLLPLVFVLVLCVATSAAAQAAGGGGVTLMDLLMSLLPLVVLVAAVYGTYILLGRLIDRWKRTAPSPPAHRSPLDILKERFARGEIDKEELEARRRILGE